VFLRFSVKLPIFGLHFWLPIAHVEAPTFGSIILAGILLKLGGIGLVRFYSFIDWHFIYTLLLSYFFVFIVVATVICCYQSDFKRLVAYSSVSHIMPIPLLMIASNVLSFKCVLMVMFFHGFASPVLFILVGLVYSMFSTRQILLIRGILLSSPLLSFIIVLAFFYTMSAPPFPSFVAEVFILLSSLRLSLYFFLFFGLFLLLSLVYNLN
jgi:NADH:ubiquinone oxidoreductase subunit 4 (subunit M)